MALVPIPFFDKRNFQSIFNAPSAFQAALKSGSFDTLFLRPLLNSLGFTAIGQKSVPASVKHLISARNPSAVYGFIIPVAVYSVKRHADLWLSQILKKIRKVQPSIANCYPSSAVIFKRGIVWVKTSLFNSKPNIMKSGFRCTVSCVGLVHHTRSFGRGLISKTAAGNNITFFKVVSTHIFGVPAIADTDKMNFSFGKLSNDKFSETVANPNRVIFFSRHKKRITRNHIINQGV